MPTVKPKPKKHTKPYPKPQIKKSKPKTKAKQRVEAKLHVDPTAWYMGMEPAVSDKDAIDYFVERFKEEPQGVYRTGGATLVGPLPEGAQAPIMQSGFYLE